MSNYILGQLLQTSPRRPAGATGATGVPSDFGFASVERGSGSIVGLVDTLGVPTVVTVVLHDHKTRRVVKSTASDSTGFFQFRNLIPGKRYFVAASDPNKVYADDISGGHIAV